MSNLGVFTLGLVLGACGAALALSVFGGAVTFDAAISITDAAGIIVNVIAVLFIPLLLARISEQRGAWVPRAVDDLETVARIAREYGATYESARDRPLNREACDRLIQSTVEARRVLRTCESRVKALAEGEAKKRTLAAVVACRDAVGTLKTTSTAGKPTAFPSKRFQPTQAEVSMTLKAAQSVEDCVYRAVAAL